MPNRYGLVARCGLKGQQHIALAVDAGEGNDCGFHGFLSDFILQLGNILRDLIVKANF
jgi:hypothetical protein